MGLKNHLFRRASLLLVVMFVFVGIFSLTSLVQAAPGDVIQVSTEEDCTAANGTWDGTTCTEAEATTSTESGSCESDGGEFSFILCPALRISNLAISFLDTRIRQNLEINPDYLKNESNGQSGGVRMAWARIRNVAYLILIPVMLMMVIGTALGFSFLDAYTVKRALPRMVVAIIFMAISYDVCRIMIEATNAIGRGMGGLIAAPFGGANNLQLTDIFEPGAGEDAGALAGGIAGSVAAFGLGLISWGILGSYLATAAVALLIIFVILTIRELLIIFLLIMAPLAIIAWIFPGNDKMWKLWWNTFSKMLLLYPIIISILMVGRGFASIVNSTTGSTDTGNFITTLVKITAYIGPFFFIPKAFQYAGNAFANIAGMVNDRGKGFFDQRRKGRAEGRKRNRERIAGDKAFRSGNADNFRGKLNTKFARAYGHKDALKEGGLLRYATAGKDGRAAGVDAITARNTKQHRDHIFEDKDVAEWIGYDDLTGLSSAVASGDEKTLEDVFRKKYRYIGDTGDIDEDGNYNTAAETELKTALDQVWQLKKSGDLRGALAKAYEIADHSRNTKAHYVREEGGSFIQTGVNAEGEAIWENVGAGNGTHSSIRGEQAFNGDARFRALSLEQVSNAFRKHGDEPLIQAMTLKALAGGTFYRNAADSWDAVLNSVTHNGHVDRNSLADMAIKGRQLLMATGRVEGAASFGATMGVLSDLEEGKIKLKDAKGAPVQVKVGGKEITISNESQLRAAVAKSLINTVYEQKGSMVFTHPDIKTGYIKDNVIPVIQERIQNAHNNAKASGVVGVDVDEDGNVISEAYKAEIMSAENLLKTLQNSKPEAIKLFSNQLFSFSPDKGVILSASDQVAQQKVQMDYLKSLEDYKVKYQQFQLEVQKRNATIEALNAGRQTLPNGEPLQVLLDPNGKPLLPPEPTEPPKPVRPTGFVETVRTDIGRFQNDPVYQNMSYQWQSAEMQWRQTVQQAQLQLQQFQYNQQLMQQMQQNGQNGIGGPGLGGGPMGPPPLTR